MENAEWGISVEVTDASHSSFSILHSPFWSPRGGAADDYVIDGDGDLSSLDCRNQNADLRA